MWLICYNVVDEYVTLYGSDLNSFAVCITRYAEILRGAAIYALYSHRVILERVSVDFFIA